MEEFQHYKAINSQLKKKFVLRKPDLNETKEQFNELSKELKSFKSYSGLCSLAAANCVHDLKNPNAEFEAYIDSARLFKEAGNVNATIFAYRKALDVCPADKKNAYYLEFGRFFESHNRYIEAADVYKESGYLKRAAHAYLRTKLFDQAYKCYSDIRRLGETDHFEPEDHVNLFLLKLIILPIKEDSISLPVVPFNTNDRIAELNILLESLALLLLDKSSKRTTLLELNSRLQKYLNGIQIDLIHLIERDILYPRS